jgi:hypothetical protein
MTYIFASAYRDKRHAMPGGIVPLPLDGGGLGWGEP